MTEILKLLMDVSSGGLLLGVNVGMQAVESSTSRQHSAS